MPKPYKCSKGKGSKYRARQQGNLIHDDVEQLLKKESDNTLSDDDIKKFRLLIAREPVIKKENDAKQENS